MSVSFFATKEKGLAAAGAFWGKYTRRTKYMTFWVEKAVAWLYTTIVFQEHNSTVCPVNHVPLLFLLSWGLGTLGSLQLSQATFLAQARQGFDPPVPFFTPYWIVSYIPLFHLLLLHTKSLKALNAS